MMKHLMGTYFSIGNAATQYSNKMCSPDSITAELSRCHSRNFQDNCVYSNLIYHFTISVELQRDQKYQIFSLNFQYPFILPIKQASILNLNDFALSQKPILSVAKKGPILLAMSLKKIQRPHNTEKES